jgi:hypothetical protein
MFQTRVGAEAAHGFPRAEFDRAYFEAAVRTPGLSDGDVKLEITAACLAAVYRHRRASEIAKEVSALVALPRDRRDNGWHFEIQTRLYEFFVAVLSTFESSIYGLYFVGSCLEPGHFPSVEPEKRKRIAPASTAKAYAAAWPQEPLTALLTEITTSAAYAELSDTRNVLAHRIVPGLEHRLTLPGEIYELAWRGQSLASFIPDTLGWAEEELRRLWEATANFLEARAPHLEAAPGEVESAASEPDSSADESATDPPVAG